MSFNIFSHISVEKRILGSKKTIRDLLSSSKIPAILYSKNENTPITVNVLAIKKIVADPSCFTRIFELQFENGDKKKVMIKEIKFDPVKDTAVHIDFMGVEAGQKVKVGVPLRIVNKALCPGVKTGGDVFVLSYHVPLICEADHVPSSIDIDVADKAIGSKVWLSDIELPKGSKMIKDVILIKVSGKRVISDEAKAADATIAESATTTAA